jgi:L-lactate dehydrogenase complex protein LldE
MSPQQTQATSVREPPRVALFVTCLVDLFRPAIGFAAAQLLEDAGCTVAVPRAQTCCGQPAYNQGDRADSVDLARQTIDALQGYDYVVVPSGSCAGMLRQHYPELFAAGSADGERARELAARTYELVSFLTDVMGVTSVAAECPAASLTTMPVRACASSASNSSRVGYWKACAASS